MDIQPQLTNPLELVGFDCRLAPNAIYLSSHFNLSDGTRMISEYCLN